LEAHATLARFKSESSAVNIFGVFAVPQIGRSPRFAGGRTGSGSSPLPSLGAPVDEETNQDQEDRAAGDLRFVKPNVGGAWRRNHGDDHGQERNRQPADTNDQSAGRAAGDD
jgi:hypothetical protein